jgi:hypothetical protein
VSTSIIWFTYVISVYLYHMIYLSVCYFYICFICFQLFWMPMYNSLFLDQWMLLDRRTILMEEDQYMKSKNQKKETKVYICTTMYREVRLIYVLTLLCYRTYSLCLLSMSSYRPFWSTNGHETANSDLWMVLISLILFLFVINCDFL